MAGGRLNASEQGRPPRVEEGGRVANQKTGDPRPMNAWLANLGRGGIGVIVGGAIVIASSVLLGVAIRAFLWSSGLGG